VRLFGIPVKLVTKVTVDVPEAFPKPEARRMTCSAPQCLDKARECESMASQARDGDGKALFVELAKQWLVLARQKEDIERNQLS
jgi:hypothetical protein